jgi:ubiquinone/menaquinone biosynthesis C-methylase UbiE/uncharacterized protein YbaR (Trm112 family)
MRYSLLEFICCPSCNEKLRCFVFEENLIEGSDNKDISSGLLICNECGHWYPIIGGIPEMLPDHLQDWKCEMDFLSSLEGKLLGDIRDELVENGKIFSRQCASVKDNGSHFKKAEISIKDKVTDEGFFAPGYTAPFNRENPDFTINLLKRMSFILPLLDLKPGDSVLDVGCGYSWTTEWLMKLGYEAVGVDITRTYLDIGLTRMGNHRPHLILADTENLPIKNASFKSILCYDAFHHIPNRKKAMTHFFRILKKGGKVVLAEPGIEHDYHPNSIEVMKKYGILEKGMELEDIREYSEGLNFDCPGQHYLFKIEEKKPGKTLFSSFANIQPYVDANIYTLEKKEQVGIKDSKSLIFHVKSFIKLLIFKFFIKRQKKPIKKRNACFSLTRKKEG